MLLENSKIFILKFKNKQPSISLAKKETLRFHMSSRLVLLFEEVLTSFINESYFNKKALYSVLKVKTICKLLLN